MRAALIQSTPDAVANYLPDNYRVVDYDPRGVYIEGEDVAGWTLDDYVLPRLASGLYFGQEVEPREPSVLCTCRNCETQYRISQRLVDAAASPSSKWINLCPSCIQDEV
jgi:hypothetical protein